MSVLNKKGFTLIELLIVTVIGLFLLEAVYLLYSGSLKLFRDVKATSDNLETKVPSIELISRYFERWGVSVMSTGTDCASYPPSQKKCITLTESSPCDEVVFWGNLYGFGFVQSVASQTATLASCRLSTESGHNCYYHWSNDVLVNAMVGIYPYPLRLKNFSPRALTPENADCTGLTLASSTNATVDSFMSNFNVFWGISGTTLQPGDYILRAPHRIRFYCNQNSDDGNRLWLYVDTTDEACNPTCASGDTACETFRTACLASDCRINETAAPLAPVDSFQVQLLPSGCDPASATAGCTAAKVDITFRSQSKVYNPRAPDKEFSTLSVRRVFSR